MRLINRLLDYRQPWTLPDVRLFTGNAVVGDTGRLVMGRGAAKACRDAWKDCDLQMAVAVKAAIERHRHLAFVALKGPSTMADQFLGWFQTKNHWREDSDLQVIALAAVELAEVAAARPAVQFHLNAPGVGAGRLQWRDVRPLLDCLPDSVSVYLGES